MIDVGRIVVRMRIRTHTKFGKGSVTQDAATFFV